LLAITRQTGFFAKAGELGGLRLAVVQSLRARRVDARSDQPGADGGTNLGRRLQSDALMDGG
jgi:hypothetical protein